MHLFFVLACLPKIATVTLIRVQVAPTAPDGTAWDGPNLNLPVSMVPLQSLDSKTQAALVIAQDALAASAPPDVYGTAMLGGTALQLTERPDTFSPTWCVSEQLLQCPSFFGVNLRETGALTLTLIDADLMQNDLLPPVVLSSEQLVQAYKERKPMAIDTSAQGGGGVQYVVVLVERQRM